MTAGEENNGAEAPPLILWGNPLIGARIAQPSAEPYGRSAMPAHVPLPFEIADSVVGTIDLTLGCLAGIVFVWLALMRRARRPPMPATPDDRNDRAAAPASWRDAIRPRPPADSVGALNRVPQFATDEPAGDDRGTVSGS